MTLLDKKLRGHLIARRRLREEYLKLFVELDDVCEEFMTERREGNDFSAERALHKLSVLEVSTKLFLGRAAVKHDKKFSAILALALPEIRVLGRCFSDEALENKIYTRAIEAEVFEVMEAVLTQLCAWLEPLEEY